MSPWSSALGSRVLARVAVVAVLAAAVVAVASSGGAVAQPGGFGDVPDDAFYSVAVSTLADRGVFDGTHCGEGFCPGGLIDRKTMAVWTVRLLDGGDPPAVSQTRFDDVDPESFQARFIERLAELGVTRGCGDGSGFCPGRDTTRAEMAVFLSRAYELPDGPDPGFADVPGDAWYAADVARLAASGITVGCGDGSGFCPGRDTSRAEMATFLYRAENRAETDESEDSADESTDGGGGGGFGGGGGGVGGSSLGRQPSGVTVEAVPRGLQVSWSAPAGSRRRTGYGVYWRAEALPAGGAAAGRSARSVGGASGLVGVRAVSGDGVFVSGCVLVGADETAVTLEGLVAGVDYVVGVSAFYRGEACEDRTRGGAVAAAGAAAPQPLAAPLGAPGSLVVAADPAGRAGAAAAGGAPVEVAVAWVAPFAPASAPVLFMELEWKPDDVPTYVEAASGALVGAGSPRGVGGLLLGGTYDFRLRAWNTDGAGAWTSPGWGQEVLVAYGPDAPGGVEAVGGGDGEFAVSWQAPAFDGGAIVEGYRLQWRPDGGVFEAVDAPGGVRTVDVGPGVRERAVTGLGAGVYGVRVLARNAAAYGHAAEAAVTVGVAPAPPAGLTVRGHPQGLELSWDAPSGVVDGYELRYRRADDAVWPPEQSVGRVTSHVVRGLEVGVGYEVQVRASNSYGNSGWAHAAAAAGAVPGAPGAVSVADNGASGIAVSWSAPAAAGSGIDGYRVQWTDSSSFAAAASRTLGAAARRFVVPLDLLVKGRVYRVRVAAFNAAGEAASAAGDAAATTVPGVPGDVGISPGDEQVTIVWAAVADAGGTAVTGHVVQWAGNAAFARAGRDGTVAAAAREHTVTGLNNGAPVWVRVAAVNATGRGGWSAPVSAAPSEAAAQPGAVAVAALGRGLAVSWTAPQQSGLVGYTLRWHAAPGQVHTHSGQQSAAAADTAADIAGLVAGIEYRVNVEARYSGGVSASAAAATGTPAAQQARLGAPTAVVVAADPDGRRAAASAPSDPVGVAVSWTAPDAGSAAPVIFSELQWKLDSAASWPSDDRAVLSGGSPQTLGGFALGASYDFRLRAWNLDGAGAWADAPARIVAYAPDAPTGAAVTAGEADGLGSGELRASWQAPSFDGGRAVTGYVVQWTGTDPAGGFTAAGAATTSDTGHTIGALTDGTRHWVRVAARNAAGDGAWSTTRSAVPSTRPDRPTIDSLTVGDRRLRVDWTQGHNGGSAVTGFDVRYRTSDTGNGAGTWQMWPHNSNATAATITTLVNGQPYDVEVAATNINGTGAWSATASATPATAPDAPAVTSVAAGTANDLGSGEIRVRWTAPADDGGSAVTGYEVQYRPGGSGSAGWQTWPHTGTSTTAVIDGLTNGRSHDVRVAATNAAGTGAWSATNSATPSTVPDAPTISLTASDHSITAAWQAPATGGSPITGYELQWTTTEPQGQTFAATGQATAAADASDHTIDGLTNDIDHWVRLSAANINGNSAWSATGSATPVDNIVPALTEAAVSADGTIITLTFDEALDDTQQLTPERFTFTAAGDILGVSITGSAVTLTLEHRIQRSAFVTVTYRGPADDGAIADAAGNLVARFTTGASGVPALANGSTVRAPDAVTELAALAGDSLLRVSWKAPADTGGLPIDHYEVASRASSASGYTAHGRVAASPGDTADTVYSTDVSGLANGTAYTVRVTAVNAFNAGRTAGHPRSAATTASVTAGDPDPIRNLRVVSRNGELRTTWDPPVNAAVFPDTDDAQLLYLVEWLKTGRVGREAFNTRYIRHDAGLVSGSDNGYRVVFARVSHGPFDPQAVFAGVSDLDPLTNDTRYTVRVTPVYAPAQAVTGEDSSLLIHGPRADTTAVPDVESLFEDSPLHDRARSALDGVVGTYGGDWPWLARAWGEVSFGAQVYDIPGRARASFSYDCWPDASDSPFDSLGYCARASELTVDLDEALARTTPEGVALEGFESVPIHELAHAYTLGSDLPEPAWAWGLALLYFYANANADDYNETYCPTELLADTMTVLVYPQHYLPYYDICFDDPPSQAVRDEMAAAVRSAAAGVESAWFVSNYRAGGAGDGAVDRRQVWTDVKAVPTTLRRHVVVGLLRYAFGGYCSPAAARKGAFAFEYRRDIVDPWNDGGCGPGAPTGVTAAAAATAGEVTVSWAKPADSRGAPVTGYIVQWRTGTQTYDASRRKVLAGRPDATAATVSGLTGGTARTVRVLALNSIGAGDPSAETTVTPALLAAPTAVPAPRDVTLLQRDAGLDVAWLPPRNDGARQVTGYKVQWRLESEQWDTTREATVTTAPPGAGDTWVHPIRGLTAPNTYFVRVITVDSNDATGASEEVSSPTRTSSASLKDHIRTEVVEKHEADHPWLRAAYDYMTDNAVLITSNDFDYPGRVRMANNRTRNGLPHNHITELEIDTHGRSSITHELAHVYTVASEVVEFSPPIGMASLYFHRHWPWNPGSFFYRCPSFELLADAYSHSVHGGNVAYLSYWYTCFLASFDRRNPPSAEDRAILQSATGSTIPSWFVEEFDGDARRVWATLLSFPSGDHFTDAADHKHGIITVAWLGQFRDLFGGYCSDEAAAKAALRDKSAPYAAHTNPWRLGVGGCEHQEATATGGGGQITVSWTAPADDGTFDITGYRVQWRSGFQRYSADRQTELAATATTHTIASLEAATAYQVRVVAFNARGEIVSFGDIAVSTTATTTDATPDLPASSDQAQL